MRRLGHRDGRAAARRRRPSSTDSAPAIEPNIGITRSLRQSPSRFSAGITSGDVGGAGDQAGVGRVDQDRLVGDVRMALGRGVHLLLEHALVDGARPSTSGRRRRAPPIRSRLPEGVLGDRAADPARDPLGAEGDLVGSAVAPSRHCSAP